MKNWKKYEKQILGKIVRDFPGCTVCGDVKKTGRFSEVKRQIDVLAEGQIFTEDSTLVVECKYFSKKVDVKVIDSFVGFLDDIGAKFGVLITNVGFSKAASRRADGAKSISYIDIVPFEEWDEFDLFSSFGIEGYSSKYASAAGSLHTLEFKKLYLRSDEIDLAYDEITQSLEFYCPNEECGRLVKMDYGDSGDFFECVCGRKYHAYESMDGDGVGSIELEVVK